MREQIAEFKEQEKKIKEDLEAWVKDESIPLEERWQVLIDSELGEHISCVEEPDGINWNKHTLYDDFYTDRYVIITMKSIYDIAKRKNLFEENGETEFKQYCINNFIHSFTNDW